MARSAVEWPAHLLPVLKPYRLRLALAATAMLLGALFTVLQPWPLKVVLDHVIANRPSRVPFLQHWLGDAVVSRQTVLYGACVTMLALAVLNGLLTYCYTRTMGRTAQEFAFELRARLFAHMQRLSLLFHDRQRTGDLLTRLTADIQAIQDVLASGLILLVSNSCVLLGMLTVMLWLNWRFALVSLSVAPLLFWIVLRHRRLIRAASQAARASDGLLAAMAQETLAGIRTVQALAQEDRQDEAFRTRGAASLRAYLEGVRYQSRLAPLVDVAAAAGLAIVMWFGATRAMAGELTAGDVIVFFTYVGNLYAPMKALARFTLNVSRASVGAERIAEVLGTRPDVADQKGARRAERFRGQIEFANVSFSYGDRKSVLSNVDLLIRPGERVALVGSSGAGKSTLLSLVARLYDPSQGAVLIDGHNARDFTVEWLRSQVSMVLQDSLLFSGSVRDNIAFACPGASDDEIVSAARTANAHEFIEQLPDGYDTLLGERGANLSGGQKQRIAIARAVLRNSPVLLLDEPTSGLDAESEMLVMKALDRAAEGRTTIMATHRLSASQLANRILVVEDGRVVEDGTRAGLLGRGGRFADLCRHQLPVDLARDIANIHSPLVAR